MCVCLHKIIFFSVILKWSGLIQADRLLDTSKTLDCGRYSHNRVQMPSRDGCSLIEAESRWDHGGSVSTGCLIWQLTEDGGGEAKILCSLGGGRYLCFKIPSCISAIHPLLPSPSWISDPKSPPHIPSHLNPPSSTSYPVHPLLIHTAFFPHFTPSPPAQAP